MAGGLFRGARGYIPPCRRGGPGQGGANVVQHSPPRLLTERELEILQHVAEGLSNSQIGKQLWVTEQTVKFHLSNIYRKLGVGNRTEATRYAYRAKLIE